MGNERVTNDTVELCVPAGYEFASVVRLVAASMAADAHLSVDDVEDLRLAVNEVFASAVVAHDQAPGVITVRYRAAASELVVELTTESGIDIVLDELAASIIRFAVDDFNVDPGRVVLSKRRPTSG
jgi:hypothetical protein